jgi:hypothetical protein
LKKTILKNFVNDIIKKLWVITKKQTLNLKKTFFKTKKQTKTSQFLKAKLWKGRKKD